MGRQAPGEPEASDSNTVVYIPYPEWLLPRYQPVRSVCKCGQHVRTFTLTQLFVAWWMGHPEK